MKYPAKKISIPSYIMRTKWIVLVIAVIVLVILGRTIENPALTETAIVVGVGIDYSDAEGFTVSSQSVIISQNSAEGNSNNSYATYTEKGKTISQALDSISRKMGLTLSLAHCNAVYLSESALKLNHLELVSALTGIYSLPEQAIIVSGELPPEKLIAARVSATVSAPFFLQTTVSKHEGSDGTMRTTVKDFMARSCSRSKANVIPYIRTKPQEEPPLSSQGEEGENVEYIMSESLAFDSDSNIIIESSLAEVLSLYLSQEVVGTLNYTFPTGESLEFMVMERKLKTKTNAKQRDISAELKLSVNLLEGQHLNSGHRVSSADEIAQRAAQELSKELSAKLTELFKLSKECGIDFLNLQTKAYQSIGRTLERDCLDTLSFSPTVKIEISESS